MEPTNKELTIQAFKDLIVKYRNPEGQIFGRYDSCPLCTIHNHAGYGGDCTGCPLADKYGQQGCNDFESYPDNLDTNDTVVYIITDSPNNIALCNKRAEFFEKYLPVIMECSEEQFTAGDWEYFNFNLKD